MKNQSLFASEVQAFVINLDHSTARLEAIQAQAQAAGLSLTRVPGLLGRAVDLRHATDVDSRGYALRHGRAINMNEVGCYLSHLRALKAFWTRTQRSGLFWKTTQLCQQGIST